jgi:DDE superfamily endonuclease
MELVTRHWSGKHQRVVMGINLITTLWTDGAKLIPCDFRVYDKPMGVEGPFGGKDKNEHMRDMLTAAKGRGLNPRYVIFDSWYTGLDNLKLIRSLGWHWFARLKSNRLVNPDDTENVPVSGIAIPRRGRVVHLKAYGFVKVFKTVSSNGDVDYWATDDLEMKEKARKGGPAGPGMGHRGLPQRDQAVLWRREVSGMEDAEADRPHNPGPEGIPQTGARQDETRRNELVRVQDIGGTGGHTRLSGKSLPS